MCLTVMMRKEWTSETICSSSFAFGVSTERWLHNEIIYKVVCQVFDLGSCFLLDGMCPKIMTRCKTYCMTQKIRSEVNILLFQSQSIFAKIDLKISLHDFPFFFFHSTDGINATAVWLLCNIHNKSMQYEKYEIKIQIKFMCIVMCKKQCSLGKMRPLSFQGEILAAS